MANSTRRLGEAVLRVASDRLRDVIKRTRNSDAASKHIVLNS